MTNILIATPMYGGMCSGEYTRSMIHVPITLNANWIDVSFAFIFNNSLIQSARNQLSAVFMRNDFTHLMFIDADIKFSALDIISMIKADKPVIAGVYPRKEINWHLVNYASSIGVAPERLNEYSGSLVVNLIGENKEQVVSQYEPAEVSRAGTGFMLIKREVMDKLKDHVDYFSDADTRSNMHEFFFVKKDPVTNLQLSEDYAFCDLCREHGFNIYVAPWVKLAHMGSYLFEGSMIPVQGK